MCHWCLRLPVGRFPGAGFLVLIKKYYKDGVIKHTIVLLRLAGSGKLTLPGGRVDATDGGCVITTIQRETYEECGLNLDRFPIIDCCYLGDTRTVLVFASAPNDIKRSTIDRITLRMQHRHHRQCYHEMLAHCEFLDFNSGYLIPESDRIPFGSDDRCSIIRDTITFIRRNYSHLFR